MRWLTVGVQVGLVCSLVVVCIKLARMEWEEHFGRQNRKQ